MNYAKINSDTNFLMTSTAQVDYTWRVLSDFAVDADGLRYQYYLDRLTPDLPKHQAALNTKIRQTIEDEIKTTNITYDGHEYPLGLETLNHLALMKVAFLSLAPNAKLSWFDKRDEVVKLKENDVDDIIALCLTTEEVIITNYTP